MPDLIFVMANPRKTRMENTTGVFSPLTKGQVALIEEHPNHPYDPGVKENRVFIVQGDPPCEAYLSEGVQEKLLQNQLVQISRADALVKYRSMTGNDYPGTTPTPEPEVDEDEEVELTPAEKRKATLAAKRADADADADADAESE